MRIRKISQMTPPGGGRKVRAIVMGGPGGRKKIHLLPDQGLGESCHKIADLLNSGVAINEQSWDDQPPDDIRYEQEAQQAGM